MDAQSSLLVFRKKPNCRFSSPPPPSLSIPAAIADTLSLSTLSSVTAKRRIARCHALIIQACHSFGPSRNFMSVTIDGPEREYDLTLSADLVGGDRNRLMGFLCRDCSRSMRPVRFDRA